VVFDDTSMGNTLLAWIRHRVFFLVIAPERYSNFHPEFLRSFSARLNLHRDKKTKAGQIRAPMIFHYIYALFHSPTYRNRYDEFLR